MNCPRCHAELPDVAHFCHVCGQDVRSDDLTRRRSFAAKPDEPVASFALVSTIMPRGAGQRPQTYRIALTIAMAVALIAAIFGALPIAILVAAFAIPIVYIVYLYDVNLWEDEPIPVTGLAFGLTGVLTILFTILVMLAAAAGCPTTALDGTDLGGGPSVWTFLLVALVVPIVGEAIRQIGPMLLASRPEFDDLMDGLTFGVVSGVAYACFDTIVRLWDLLIGGPVEADPGLWVSLIFLHGFVKPLLHGHGHRHRLCGVLGPGPRVRRLHPALLPGGWWRRCWPTSASGRHLPAVLRQQPDDVGRAQHGWGLLILGILILRVRNVLHTGLLEAALERSARDGGIGSSGELQFCARCEMPLLDNASFCTACGTAVRAQAKPHKAAVSASVGAAQGPGAASGPVPAATVPAAGPAEPPPALATAVPAGIGGLDGRAGSDADAKNRFYDDEEGRA